MIADSFVPRCTVGVTAMPLTGSKVAVSLSRNGSEDGVLHVYEVASGRELEPPIEKVQYPTAGGALAWTADGQGFWYKRYPGADAPESERHFNQTLWLHRLGTPVSADKQVLSAKDGLPRTAEIFLDNRRGGASALASIQLGDGGQFQHFVLTPDGGAVRISRQVPGMGEEALAVLRAGTHFGEMALIDDFPRSADARAHEACRLFVIRKEDLEDLLFVDRDLAYDLLWSFVRTLSGRLRETNDKMTFMAVTSKF